MLIPPSSKDILSRLLGPLQFGARDGFKHLHTLRAFEGMVVSVVDEAVRSGLSESAAHDLRHLIRDFDTMSHASRVNALRVLVDHLAPLVTLPPELASIALHAPAKPVPAPAPVVEVATPAPKPRQKALPLSTTKARARTPAPSTPVTADDDDTAAPSVQRQPTLKFSEGPLATPLKEVGRIHSRLQSVLTKKGILTAADVLYLLPRTYEDRRQIGTVAQWRPGERGSALVEVKHHEEMRRGQRMMRIVFGDSTGTVAGLFFHAGNWMKSRFPVGGRFLISGELRAGAHGRDIANPEVEPASDWPGPGHPRAPGVPPSLHFERIVPIYPGFERGEQRTYRELAARVVDRFASSMEDLVPESLRRHLALPALGDALRELHFPQDGADLGRLSRWSSTAHRRLAFDELFFLQLGLAIRRQGVRIEPGIPFAVDDALMAKAMACLPFKMTGAQTRVLTEIAGDMRRPEPMNRLLQGDVGSGKTAVALVAALIAIENGYQATVMAPTELLASQHARTLGKMLSSAGIEVALLVGAISARERTRVVEGLNAGRIKLVVGTHALLEEDVKLDRLGLVVIDEQHRFGVLQRGVLRDKGLRPDVLVMTATPIPRTLAMAAYGDLDLSVIDELPPGRTPIHTKVFDARNREKAHELVRTELAAGRQAYVVYPLVEESEKSDLANATEGRELMMEAFQGYEVGLLHGRMKAAEKDATMTAFRAGELKVLVATTVVEVGVDVPNATIMLIENAERFGLSQLHQLRGRVGRGAHASHCLLVAGPAQGPLARERLSVMEESTDGFVIAERDLELRGPGEFLGTRQSGLPELAVANLARDQDLLAVAQKEAQKLVADDPALKKPEHHGLKAALGQRWAGKLALAKIG